MALKRMNIMYLLRMDFILKYDYIQARMQAGVKWLNDLFDMINRTNKILRNGGKTFQSQFTRKNVMC